MTMYFVGIDISKYKHDCCIISADNPKVVSKFTIKNNKSDFEQLHLTLNSLSTPQYIKIGFESTAHYALILNSSLRMPTTASWKLIQF
jgi:transposase